MRSDLVRARWARAVGLDRIPGAEPGSEADDGLDHLCVAVPVDDADNLGQAETSVLDALDPPLNLRGRPPGAIRTRLAHLRRDAGAARALEPSS